MTVEPRRVRVVLLGPPERSLAPCSVRRRPSANQEESRPEGAWVVGFRPPALCVKMCLLFTTPSLCYLLRIALLHARN